MYDVIIVGGSYAGLSAALQLGRARRRVLVVDAGQRRNRFASSSHGFLSRDGDSPAAIVAKGRSEVLAYPTVSWLEGTVDDARAVEDGFAVRAGDDEHRTKRILATGVADELPPVPGLAERWGKTVFHCPYCHGYELGKGRLGVLATSALATHSVALVSEWAGANQTTLFLDDAFEPDAEQLAELAKRGIRLERERVTSIDGEAPAIDLHHQDGRTSHLDGLFVVARTAIKTPLAERLGCTLEVGPVGPVYKTDAMKETSVPGVFACGDVALMAGTVAFAVADGAMAGISAHKSLVFR